MATEQDYLKAQERYYKAVKAFNDEFFKLSDDQREALLHPLWDMLYALRRLTSIRDSYWNEEFFYEAGEEPVRLR